MKRLILILNGKGGVGKSFFAVNFVQYLKDKGIAHTAIDSDNENSTLKRFHPDTHFLDLADRRGLDGIFSALEKSNASVSEFMNVALDTGCWPQAMAPSNPAVCPAASTASATCRVAAAVICSCGLFIDSRSAFPVHLPNKFASSIYNHLAGKHDGERRAQRRNFFQPRGGGLGA